jgi:hypothetical protein
MTKLIFVFHSFGKALKNNLISFKLSNIWSPTEMHATCVTVALTTQRICLFLHYFQLSSKVSSDVISLPRLINYFICPGF